jgi:hypothetical protein
VPPPADISPHDSIELLIPQRVAHQAWKQRAHGHALALVCGRKVGHEVAQRSIEVFIGRLVTDEGFRASFVRNAGTAIRQFIDTGQELTPVEIAALLATRTDVWEHLADRIDQRLQRVSVISDESGSWLHVRRS